MSSMTSYTVRCTPKTYKSDKSDQMSDENKVVKWLGAKLDQKKRERAYESALNYFLKNEKKLIKELRENGELSKHRKCNILSEERLVKIQNEFQSLYKSWNIKTAYIGRRESITLNMDEYILKLKVQLNEALDYEAIQKERLRIKKEILEHTQSIAEEIYETSMPNVNTKIKTYIKEAEFILERVKQYDDAFYLSQKEKFEKLLSTNIEQKVKLFYDNLKLEYGKIKTISIWTNVYRESLESFKIEEPINNNPDLMYKIDVLLNQKQISENMYDELYSKIQEKITFFEENQQEILDADRIIAALEKLDYLVIPENKEQIVEKLSKQEKVELHVKDKDYRVVVKFNSDNNLLTRFVRVVADKKDIKRLSSSEKLKDAENTKKWCKYQNDFIQYIKDDGFELDQTIIEDDKSELLYVVDADLHKEQQKNTYKKEKGYV